MTKRTIGLIGCGLIGGTLARLWAKAGYPLLLSARHPEKLNELARELAPSAQVRTPLQAARDSQIILLSIPLREVSRLDAELVGALAGKIVLDTTNPYPERDKEAAVEVAALARGSGAWVAQKLPGARVVKAFNTVYFKTLASEAHRLSERVGIPIAGDDAAALDVASRLILSAGFEPVVVGRLETARTFDPGTPAYNTGAAARDVKRLLGLEPGLSTEEMKDFVRDHFHDFVNLKKSEVARKNFSRDFLDHDEAGGPTLGPEPAQQMMEGAYRRWPDLHVEVEDIIAEGDKVMVRNVWTATEKDSGKKIEFRGFVLWRFANRQIVERWATLTPPQEV